MNPIAEEIGGRIKITYRDGADTYSGEFTLSQLQSMHKFFRIPSNTYEAVDYLNKASEKGKCTPQPRGNSVNLSYYMMMGMNGEPVVIPLQMEQRYQPPPQPYIPPPQPQRLRAEPPKQHVHDHNCQCPLDHDRIDKLDVKSKEFIANDQTNEYKIRDLIRQMEELKQRNVQIRNDNEALTRKTEEIKQRYLQLIEEEARLRGYVEDLKTKNQEMQITIKELEFQLKDQHLHEGIEEVFVPLDETRKTRVTNAQEVASSPDGGDVLRSYKYRSIDYSKNTY